MYSPNIKLFRAEILYFLDDPKKVAEDRCFQYFEDGILIIKDGYVEAVGPADKLMRELPKDIPVEHYPGHLILPGFVDTHIHYPQSDMVASYGEQLLEWLENYTFPAEASFSDMGKALEVSEFFLDELLRNGTTTAMVFATVHEESVEAFFQTAQKQNLRMICGKVLMDRNATEALHDTPESGYRQSKALIDKWHGTSRLRYAVTPRFAITCSPAQLTAAGKLLKEYPGVYLQTHLSENKSEVAFVKKLFPACDNYLDVYERFGLLGPQSVFAHCIHLNNDEFMTIADTNSKIAFCPTSNLFLGSGLFDLARSDESMIEIGLGTDIGAGTSFSMLETMNEAYKVQQLLGNRFSPFQAFYLATLGGARALEIDSKIGNFQQGKEADFCVIDYKAKPLLARRLQKGTDLLRDKLFALMMMGDDRVIKEVFVMGEKTTRQTIDRIVA